MAKVLVLVDDDCVDLGVRVRRLLGEGHQYKLVAVTPDHHSPFLNETAKAAQDDDQRTYADAARRAAEAIGAEVEVRMGNPAVEMIAAAQADGADIVVVETDRPGWWARLTQHSAAEYALTHATCAVLFLPKVANAHS
ncbi:MAG TPA: universal stress protein [Acidimicrobiales bacterium]|jgi:nucleotide-binding universal stress UspA family protein|nr:universal stress protein [Acidimicrobiales bacterium]